MADKKKKATEPVDEQVVIPDGEQVTEATLENLSNNKGDDE